MADEDPPPDAPDVSPEDFLRALLAISPADAARARERAAKRAAGEDESG